MSENAARRNISCCQILAVKLRSQVTVRGQEIQVEDENRDEVKLIKKFLHQEGLGAYRVLNEGGTIRVVLAEKEQPQRKVMDSKIKGVLPFPRVSTERLPMDANRLS